jgi:hypothetical protein
MVREYPVVQFGITGYFREPGGDRLAGRGMFTSLLLALS